MKILFLSSEGLPYSKTGGLADVVQALPKALAEMGHEVAVLLPRYRGNKIASTLVSSVTITMGDQLRFPSIAEGAAVAGVRYFFVVDRGFYDREQLYGEKGIDYPDNAERFTEFSRAAIEFAYPLFLLGFTIEVNRLRTFSAVELLLTRSLRTGRIFAHRGAHEETHLLQCLGWV